MSAKKRNLIQFSKKNDGQHIMIDFEYYSHKVLDTTEKIRVELWIRQQGTLMLHSFKVQFPELIIS